MHCVVSRASEDMPGDCAPAESEIMDIHALQQIVHQTRDARREQTIPKFPPADRDLT